MFKNLTIRSKMTLLAFVAIVLLAFLGGGAYVMGSQLINDLAVSASTGRNATDAVAKARSAHVNFQRQVQEWKDVLIRGNDAALYEKHFKAFQERARDVQTELADAQKTLAQIGVPTDLVQQLRKDHADMLDKYLGALKTFDAADPETGKKVDIQVRGVDRATSANFDKLIDQVVQHTDATLAQREAEASESARIATYGGAAAALTALLVFLLGFAIMRRLNADIRGLNGVVERLNTGDFAARASVTTNSKDELNQLGGALNQLLDDRLNALQVATRENVQLNDSITNIMMSVAEMAQRDLAVRVPVTEDVTGAVADAINMMASSTAKALGEVNRISGAVSDSTQRVKMRGETVYRLADEASSQASAASSELGQTANVLREIGDQAQEAGRDAERALVKTGEALSVVRATVDGITVSRDQIRETEKRVKRLAERSQEISSAVGIIGKIAERTSVLALNASMQAVAAGEAGRGFAAVADEVKRLAENAREATQQIAGLVGAIQSDTTETLQAMNGTISQVVDITRLADQAGLQMSETRAATEALAGSVRTISEATRVQAETSQRLIARAGDLIDASRRTLDEIGQQREDTDALNVAASALVRTVGEFKLPANA